MTRLRRCQIRSNITAVAMICSLLLPSVDVRADEPQPAPTPALGAVTPLPSFQPGLWEYRRTMFDQGSNKPQLSTVTKCSDPTSDIRQKMESLKGKSCQFTSTRHIQDHYVSNWICQTGNGPVRFHDVLTAKDAATYVDVSEAQLSQRVTRSRLEAVRLGDCPSSKAGVLDHPSAKPVPTPKSVPTLKPSRRTPATE
jgi:hypothetical protein